MTFIEQHKIIARLSYYSGKMSRVDYDEYEMLRSRDKEDEDFEKPSRVRLQELYEKYVPERYRW